MSNLSVAAKITGLDADIEREIKRVKGKIPQALQYVGNEMSEMLKGKIGDIYDAYEPVVYKRRSDYPQYGTPLESDQNIDISVKGQTLDFTYTPTGKHAQENWSKRGNDALINWLQTEHPSETVRSHPFWDEFVDELEYGAVPLFIQGMEIADPKLKIVKEPTETVHLAEAKRLDVSNIIYAQNTDNESLFDDDDGDGDLPF